MKSLQQLFELNLNTLQSNIVRGFPNTKKRQHISNTVNITNLQLVPYPMQHALEADAVALSKGNRYSPVIMFEEVEFEEADSPNVVSFKAATGDEYHIVPISRRMHDVKVACDCMDYIARFGIYNFQADTQYGAGPPPYRRTTNRPPVNPMKVEGWCKHLIRLGDHLQQIGILKP